MIGLEWGVYSIVIAAFVGAAAWLVEGMLSRSSAPSRWIWAGALGIAVAIPVARIGPIEAVPAEVGNVVVTSAPTAAWTASDSWTLVGSIDRLLDTVAGPSTKVVRGIVSAAPGGAGLASAFLLLWGIGSVGAFCVLVWGHVRIRRRASAWPARTVSGESVRVSPSFGPATVGIRRPEIVLPEWVLSRPEPQRCLIVAHEAQHVLGGDTRLLAAAILPVVAMPWNPAVWWMLRRLRDAIELDCDRRALEGTASAVSYGRLLVDLCRTPAGPSMPLAPAIIGRPSLLERRIVALKRLRATRPGRASIAATVAVGLLAVAVACGTDVPDPRVDATAPTAEANPAPSAEPAAPPAPEPDPEPRPEPTAEPGVEPGTPGGAPEPDDSTPTPLDGPGAGPVPGLDGGGDIAAQPTFTPYTVAPEITNRSEVADALQQGYPTTLRDAGIGGRALMHFFIDETGRLRNVQIAESSGLPQLDEAALRVAEVFEFTPALNEGEPTAVWIQVPVTFESR